jgi:hypothetical protein
MQMQELVLMRRRVFPFPCDNSLQHGRISLSSALGGRVDLTHIDGNTPFVRSVRGAEERESVRGYS